MALDGIFLKYIKDEIEKEAIGGRIDKIYQPNGDEVILVIRTRLNNLRLLISARASSPRVHFTEQSIENPMVPPMLCMMLRKKLCGAKLVSIEQMGLDRVLFLNFDNTNEIGDKVKLTLVIEVMGKYSNVILIDENKKVLDALKRVSHDMSSKRQIYPGIFYETPPLQDKLCLLSENVDTIIDKILLCKEKTLNNALLEVLQGVSMIVCREIEYRAVKECDFLIDKLDRNQIENLKKMLCLLKDDVVNLKKFPVIVFDEGIAKDFSFLPISFNEGFKFQTVENFSKLLDIFYREKDKTDRMKSRSLNLLKVLNNYISRDKKKIKVQEKELLSCENKDKLRLVGDLITANIYKIEKGLEFVELENFYDENLEKIQIKLDKRLNANQNAQKYYKNYRKAKTAQQVLVYEIEKAKDEIKYLESVVDSITRSDSELELLEIKNELQEQGFLKVKTKVKSKNKELKLLEFESDDGFKILVGRNNIQNDKLTLKKAKKDDIWLHVKDSAGAHVVIVKNEKDIPEKTLTQAAILAAFHSKNKSSSNVAVDYTFIKNVKKNQGAKPGMVIYENYKTLFVTPDINIIDNLRV